MYISILVITGYALRSSCPLIYKSQAQYLMCMMYRVAYRSKSALRDDKDAWQSVKDAAPPIWVDSVKQVEEYITAIQQSSMTNNNAHI